MQIPGLKPRRRLQSESPQNFSKWGWRAMALIALGWLVYSIWFE